MSVARSRFNPGEQDTTAATRCRDPDGEALAGGSHPDRIMAKPGISTWIGAAPESVAGVIDLYLRRYDEAEAHRQQHATAIANDYYTLATDFYEYGWGDCFHFAPRVRGETVRESLLRYEHTLALRLGLHGRMRVLDVGCGVGGPMRNLARLTGATITGLTISRYQVERGTAQHHAAGLAHRVESVEGDFCRMPFPDRAFDAAYAIESCCHAADRRQPFREVFRVLRRGAYFGGYDWCLTPRFDRDDPAHERIREAIEKGDGLPPLCTTAEHDQALRDAGFEVIETCDVATTADPETPWYQPLTAGLSWRGFKNSRLGAACTHALIAVMERLHLAPAGTGATHAMLRIAQAALPAGGALGIFTPNYYFLARKP